MDSKLDALVKDAYGRTQETPDGMYCRMGRIDRAYDVMATNQYAAGYRTAITKMIEESIAVWDKADRAITNHLRMQRRANKPANIETPICDCPYCQQMPTFGGHTV